MEFVEKRELNFRRHFHFDPIKKVCGITIPQLLAIDSWDFCRSNRAFSECNSNSAVPVGEPSQITFAFRGGQVVRKMLNLLNKKLQTRGVRTWSNAKKCKHNLWRLPKLRSITHAISCLMPKRQWFHTFFWGQYLLRLSQLHLRVLKFLGTGSKQRPSKMK